jgi:biotin carboxyl carrier protein
LLRLYALGSYVEIRAPHDGEMRILVEPGMLVEGNTPLVELKGGFDGKAN